MSQFKKGQMVVLKSDKNIKGAIIDIIEENFTPQYQVFTANGIQTYYESQLDLETITTEFTAVNSACFNAGITASLIRNPSLSSLYSLNSAKIEFIPHQFRPVLKFIRSDRPRLLIADGVGVGKTIEAGLILKELQARSNLNSVLIICPRPLVSEQKWEKEMERFGEDFTALDGEKFRFCLHELNVEGEWPEKYKKAVIPYSLFDESNIFGNDKTPGLLQVDPAKFDLVIVDEAHHIRNTATYAYKAVNRFCDAAEAVIFLTATPVQLDYDDLFVLLNLLRPDLIIDKKTFHDMAEPNIYINTASTYVRSMVTHWKEKTLSQIELAHKTSWGQKVYTDNPIFNRIIHILSKDDISKEERVQLISDIENLHTFSNIINRTRRRDIGEFTIRKPYTVDIEFTDYQKKLHDKVLSVIHDILSIVHCTDNTKFMMTTIRRQTASCLFGLAPTLRSILYRHASEISDDDDALQMPFFDIEENGTVKERIEEILELADNLPKEDPKFDSMLEIIKKKSCEEKNKIMIFSSFKHTLRYLEKKLSENGFRVGMINGEIPDEERRELRTRFNPLETPIKSKEAVDILLFSEVGCEGLDYQFCDCMINYDLPWNPMKIEQRIGRIDRNGQTSESVSIYNMITPGTIDADIYERCLLRIGVFHNSVGDCEDILGQITTEINSLVYDFSLTEEERKEKIQQTTDNKIRYIKEQEELEEKQRDLFGIRVPESSFDTELKNATNFWLNPAMIQNMVLCFLSKRLGEEKDYILGNKEQKKLRLSQESRITLLNDFKSKKFVKNEINKSWKKWLESNEQMLDITFDNNCWKENPKYTFLSITHPLVQMAADFLKSKSKTYVKLKCCSKIIEHGKYPFAIYQWKMSGEYEDLKLIPISSDDKINPYLLEMLKDSSDNSESVDDDFSIWNGIDDKHHNMWEKSLLEHRKMTDELIRYKESSLKTSHAARMSTLQDQLYKSDDKSYIQMTQGKIRIAQEDFDIHMAMLAKAKDKSDILFELLAYGVLTIE